MIDNKEEIVERLKEVRREMGLLSKEFAIKAGIDPKNYSSIESGRRTIGDRLMMDISRAFNINFTWLKTGKGEKYSTQSGNYASEKIAGYQDMSIKEQNETILTGKIIPLYDAEAVAGNSFEVNMAPISRPMGLIEIGSLLKDSESALRVYGNSMTPNYPAGCIVGLRPHYDSFITPGNVYLIETEDNRYLKRLYYNCDKTAYRCVSDNHLTHEAGPMAGEYFYPDFEIPIEAVRRLFRVIGVIKRNEL